MGGFGDRADAIRRARVNVDALLQRAKANPENLRTTTRLAPRVTPPAPTGISLVAGIDSIILNWNAVPVANLARYELQFSTDPNIVDPVVRTTRETTFPFDEAVEAITYFVRVRAIIEGEGASDWSLILNTATGEVTNLADDSVSTDTVSDFAVTRDKIALDAINSSRVEDDSLTSDDLVSGAGTRVNSDSNDAFGFVQSAAFVKIVGTTFTPRGGDVVVSVSFAISQNAGATAGDWEIRRGATVLQDDSWDIGSAAFDYISLVIHDSAPGSSSVEYALYFRDGGAAGDRVELKETFLVCEDVK